MINSDSKLAKTFWEQGFAEDCPIIDFHGHMNPTPGSYLPEAGADKIYARMLRCNTRLMLFSTHEALYMPVNKHQEDIDAVRKYPDRMRAYFRINGNSPDLQADYERFVNNQDVFVGIKNLAEHFSYRLTDEIYRPFYEYINARKMLYLSHTWGSDEYDGIAEVEKFLNTYPDVIFIAGHSFYGEWDEAARLCNTYKNLYLEITAVTIGAGPLEYLVDKCGSEKILFGTDLPWFDTLHGIGYILSAKMFDTDRKNILYKNGIRILKNYEWFQKLWKA